jgi:hypothetical protein
MSFPSPGVQPQTCKKRESIIETPKNPKHCAHSENIMEMGYDIICIMQ